MLFKGFEGQAAPYNHIDIRIDINILMFFNGSKTMPHRHIFISMILYVAGFGGLGRLLPQYTFRYVDLAFL